SGTSVTGSPVFVDAAAKPRRAPAVDRAANSGTRAPSARPAGKKLAAAGTRYPAATRREAWNRTVAGERPRALATSAREPHGWRQEYWSTRRRCGFARTLSL